MISKFDYFQKPHSDVQDVSADDLLSLVNSLGNEAARDPSSQFQWLIDPDTRCSISGAKGGDGDGGFRTPGTRTGAATSSHREARAVDVYDPYSYLDTWLDRFEDGSGGNSKLAEYGLYREHPDDTKGALPVGLVPLDYKGTRKWEANFSSIKERQMHYRNGREAKNGDKIVQIEGGKITAFGVLHGAVPGSDYCNGYIAPIQNPQQYACLCDCLHADDVITLLAEKGLDKRPAGK